MANMGYCKLENTWGDFDDCQKEILMSDAEFAELGKSDYEARFRKYFRKTIKEMAEIIIQQEEQEDTDTLFKDAE